MKALIGCLCVIIWGVVCVESLVWNKIIDLPASGVVGELPFVGRAGAGVTTLPDGRLFVCGGEVGAGTRTASGAVTVRFKEK